MEQQSYAMLLPCGVGLFGGVEFVCCPKDKGVTAKDSKDDVDGKSGLQTMIMHNTYHRNLENHHSTMELHYAPKLGDITTHFTRLR